MIRKKKPLFCSECGKQLTTTKIPSLQDASLEDLWLFCPMYTMGFPRHYHKWLKRQKREPKFNPMTGEPYGKD